MAHIAKTVGTLRPRAIIADCLTFDEHLDFDGYDLLYKYPQEKELLDWTIVTTLAKILPGRFLLVEADDHEWKILADSAPTNEETDILEEVIYNDFETGRRIGVQDMIREAIRRAKNEEQV